MIFALVNLLLPLSLDGVMIAVECRAWAENIRHDRMERKGLAHFEVSNLQ